MLPCVLVKASRRRYHAPAFGGGLRMKGTDRYRVDGVSCRVDERLLKVVNLSVGGFFVETEEPLPLGVSLNLELALPRRPPVRMVGLVAWINHRDKPRNKHLPPGFGIKILRISFAEKMALLAALREADPSALRRA